MTSIQRGESSVQTGVGHGSEAWGLGCVLETEELHIVFPSPAFRTRLQQ